MSIKSKLKGDWKGGKMHFKGKGGWRGGDHSKEEGGWESSHLLHRRM